MRPFALLLVPITATVLLLGSPAAARAPDTYEDLYKVKTKRFDLAYLRAGVDFRGYDRVLIDSPEVAFERNWLRDYNSSSPGLDRRLSDEDAQDILTMARQGLGTIYAKAFTEGGYAVTTAPGTGVLAVRTSILDLRINAPDTMSAGRSVSYARKAGEAKIVVELRDSLTGALLGRAVDRRTIGDGPVYRRDAVTNRSDFEREVARWAKITVDAVNDLKESSPIDTEGNPARK